MDRRALALIVFSIICLVAGFVAGQPDDRTGCKNYHTAQASALSLCCSCQPKTADATKEPQGDSPNWYTALERPEWWLVLVGILGIGAALLTLNHMSDSSERQLRAYVVMEGGNIYNVANPIPAFEGEVIKPTGAEISNPAIGPIARLTIKNTGQTPAYRVRHWGEICLKENPLATELPPIEITDSMPYSILGPGIISTKTRYLSKTLTETEIMGLRQGTSAIYIYGEIQYVDAFKVRRTTKYRFIHNVKTGAVGVTIEITFAEQGNEAD
jgi:hypothetical protein